ncbi:hypothetical protein BH23ACI1_BH23ACI1_04620 [soil metagenome]|nr:hypothetical protein [Acidobacteriota bacterium]
MKWQKRARIAIALFVLGFVAVVVLAIRRPQPQPVDDPGVQFTDKAALAETTGGLIRHDWGAGYSLKAETERIYPDGRVVYTEATFDMPDRGGRAVTVSSDELTVGMKEKELGTALLKGNVRLVTDDGLEMRSNEATYSSGEGLLTVPGPVEFTRGRMSGSGVGATYDQNRDVIWLLDQARIQVAPDAAGGGGLEATAGAAGLARGDHYAVLTRGGRIIAPGRDLQADEITIRMTPDNQRIQALELRVNSRITGEAGGADAMSARDIDLLYAEDGRTLRHARLEDNAVVQLPGNGGQGRRVAGRTIDIDMAPDGATVTSLRAAEAVQLDLPAEPGAPQRRIRAATLDASGAAGAGLQAATFTGNVEYRETRGARGREAAIDRTARAATLIVQTAPNLGSIQQADFRGNAEIVDAPDLVARAPRILYHVVGDRMELSPGGGERGPEPEVTDGRANVKARTIDLNVTTRGMIAETDVRSTLLPQQRDGGPQKRDGAGRLPAMLNSDQPVFITSNRLEYDGATEQATYSGNATLWQDETRIQADVLVLDEAAGNLTARTDVRTLMHMTEVDAKSKGRKATETRGWSQTFVYDDASRMATYTTEARITGAHGDLTADKIELFLAKEASDLERAEAYGAVTVREGLRTARGTRLTYTAADDQYVMTGSPGIPVVIVENKPSGCEKSVGSRLTFRREVEHITLETPTGQPCGPEDRR